MFFDEVFIVPPVELRLGLQCAKGRVEFETVAWREARLHLIQHLGYTRADIGQDSRSDDQFRAGNTDIDQRF